MEECGRQPKNAQHKGQQYEVECARLPDNELISITKFTNGQLCLHCEAVCIGACVQKPPHSLSTSYTYTDPNLVASVHDIGVTESAGNRFAGSEPV